MIRHIRRSTNARRTVLALSLAATLLAAASTLTWAADYAVVAHQGVPGAAVSKADLQAIFLGDKTTWSTGAPIKLAVLEDGAAHKAFLQAVVGKTPAQFDNYWKKLVFTGKAGAPKSFADAAALADYVAKTPGAVGYVDAGTATGSAKTLKVE